MMQGSILGSVFALFAVRFSGESGFAAALLTSAYVAAMQLPELPEGPNWARISGMTAATITFASLGEPAQAHALLELRVLYTILGVIVYLAASRLVFPVASRELAHTTLRRAIADITRAQRKTIDLLCSFIEAEAATLRARDSGSVDSSALPHGSVTGPGMLACGAATASVSGYSGRSGADPLTSSTVEDGDPSAPLEAATSALNKLPELIQEAEAEPTLWNVPFSRLRPRYERMHQDLQRVARNVRGLFQALVSLKTQALLVHERHLLRAGEAEEYQSCGLQASSGSGSVAHLSCSTCVRRTCDRRPQVQPALAAAHGTLVGAPVSHAQSTDTASNMSTQREVIVATLPPLSAGAGMPAALLREMTQHHHHNSGPFELPLTDQGYSAGTDADRSAPAASALRSREHFQETELQASILKRMRGTCSTASCIAASDSQADGHDGHDDHVDHAARLSAQICGASAASSSIFRPIEPTDAAAASPLHSSSSSYASDGGAAGAVADDSSLRNRRLDTRGTESETGVLVVAPLLTDFRAVATSLDTIYELIAALLSDGLDRGAPASSLASDRIDAIAARVNGFVAVDQSRQPLDAVRARASSDLVGVNMRPQAEAPAVATSGVSSRPLPGAAAMLLLPRALEMLSSNLHRLIHHWDAIVRQHAASAAAAVLQHQDDSMPLSPASTLSTPMSPTITASTTASSPAVCAPSGTSAACSTHVEAKVSIEHGPDCAMTNEKPCRLQLSLSNIDALAYNTAAFALSQLVDTAADMAACARGLQHARDAAVQ